jgi:outer membrane protein TolC
VPQDFDLKKLITEAVNSRTDLLTMEAALKLAEANQTLAKKNRNLDLSASVYNTRSPGYDSSGTSYERGSSYGFSLSIPIPIAQIYDADLLQAANNRMQLQISLEEARNKVQFEVNQAFLQFNSAKSKLTNVLQERKAAAKSTFKSAQEVIDAHNSETELVDAKVNYAKALIYLGKVAGLRKPLPL